MQTIFLDFYVCSFSGLQSRFYHVPWFHPYRSFKHSNRAIDDVTN